MVDEIDSKTILSLLEASGCINIISVSDNPYVECEGLMSGFFVPSTNMYHLVVTQNYHDNEEDIHKALFYRLREKVWEHLLLIEKELQG